MKINFKEIFVILFVSIFIALFYNFIRDNPIDLIPKNKKELQAPDSLLFNSNFDSNIDNTNISKDTVLLENKKEQKNENENIYNTDTDSNSSITPESKNLDSKSLLKESKKGAHTNFLTVTYEQILRIIRSNDFVLIDARRPELFAKSHLPNAINLFPGEDETDLIEKILSLSTEKTYVVYCDGGNCDLSTEIAMLFENFGYKRVFIYEGGWEEWSAKVRS